MSAEFDQLVAQFERFQSKIEKMGGQFAGVGRMQEELAGLEAAATSPDRAVTVVAGPSGSIKDIRITDAAMRQSAQALSSSLMATVRRAVALSARRQAGIVEQAFGDQLHLTDRVLETQAQLFATTPEQLRATIAQEPHEPQAVQPQATGHAPSPGPVRRPGQRVEEPEDYSQQNFLGRDPRQAPPPAQRPHQRPGNGQYLNLYDEDQ